MENGVYHRLAEHLDRAVNGAPMAPSLLEILQVLFPGEEAEVALHLPIYARKTLEELQAEMPEKAGRLEEILKGMALRGTVETLVKPGKGRTYRLLPTVVGLVEVPFLKGEDTPEKRRLALLWKEYLYQGFAEELARELPLIRVVPIGESLQDPSQVLPYDALPELLSNVEDFAVGHCPCRQIASFTGEGCDHPTERCMHFGSLARYLVENGLARPISREEALELLKQATEEGLVHVCDNVNGYLRTICNCCPCCCAFFRARLQLGLETVSPSGYVARVEEEECIGCGVCEERCPVKAVELEGERAVVDPSRCIGCGVCTPTCGAGEAIRLHPRESVTPPPDLQEFIARRLKA
ncbi:MAG: 4Fe-4S binding protein [Candidatus Geothermincolales bacterium]